MSERGRNRPNCQGWKRRRVLGSDGRLLMARQSDSTVAGRVLQARRVFTDRCRALPGERFEVGCRIRTRRRNHADLWKRRESRREYPKADDGINRPNGHNSDGRHVHFIRLAFDSELFRRT
jgi:hypothetical protein